MSVETLIQTAVVRVDIALVAAWHILKIALPVMVVTGTAIMGLTHRRPPETAKARLLLRRLRQGR